MHLGADCVGPEGLEPPVQYIGHRYLIYSREPSIILM